jgi:sugar phosphate isomerase/epimerase
LDPARFFERYAVSTWLYANHPLDHALRQVAGGGFRYVEIWADGFHLDPRLGVDLSALRDLLDELGLSVHSTHSPFTGLNLGHPLLGDPSEWRRLVGQAIKDAGALGASTVVVHPSSHRDALPAELQPECWRLVRALVHDLADLAEESGTSVCLENMISRGYWRAGQSIAELVAQCPDERVGFCVDTGHSALNGLEPADEVRAAGARLKSVHAANNDGQGDLHWEPTRGVVDWARVEGALGEIGYEGRLVLEAAGRGDPDGVLARLSQLWRELA